MYERRPDSFILKLTNRCNFNCDHCYYRNQADRSFLSRPSDLALGKVALFARCLAQYAAQEELGHVNILFHGGEPLLLGPKYLEASVQAIRGELPQRCTADFSIQSNGSLLNRRIKDVLLRSDVSISISLDGDRIGQDRHKVFVNGSSSFEAVTGNILKHLHDAEGQKIFGGILAVVDLRNDPLSTFDFLSAMTLTGLDLLLPDGTHLIPPPGITRDNFRTNRDYADWLIPVFDEWFARGKRKPSIRLFENILTLLLGGDCDVEGLGNQSLSLLTIETDGEIRDSDVMSVTYEHSARFGEGIYLGEGCFQRLLTSKAFEKQAALYSKAGLCAECRACYWESICGGGLLPHRYSADRGFDNPTIYCGNLRALFEHMWKKLVRAIRTPDTSRRKSRSADSERNDLDGAADFIRSWDSPLPPAQQEIRLVRGPHGNISENGDVDDPTAVALTPAHPLFFDSIESGVEDLVRILVQEIGCITYSSCQGHRLSDGVGVRPRNVGILCRDEAEQLFLHDLLQAAAAMAAPGHALIEKGSLRSGEEVFRTVEIRFEPGEADADQYLGTIDDNYRVFVGNLRRTWMGSRAHSQQGGK